jgi:dipeptidyl aminopeptidase/acylaminoacyl peptidase
MFSQRLSKIICAVFLTIPFLILITSCDDFKDESFKIDSVDDIGIEAITDNDAAEIIKPMNISWNDSLQKYIVTNIGQANTFEVSSINSVWDSLIYYDAEVFKTDFRRIEAYDFQNILIVTYKDTVNNSVIKIDTVNFDNNPVVFDVTQYMTDSTFSNFDTTMLTIQLNVDSVLLSSVDSRIDQLKSNPSVDSIFVSVPLPNYFMTVGGNLDGYSVAYRSSTAGKLNIYSDNFVDIQIIDISSMDSTYLVSNSIPLEMIAEYYVATDNNLADPLLKSFVSIELENKDYIIQLKKTETTVNSGKTYFSLVTE